MSGDPSMRTQHEMERMKLSELMDYHMALLNTPARSTQLQQALELSAKILLKRQVRAGRWHSAESAVRTGWIYIIRAETGDYKIGRARNAPQRVSEIMTTLPFRADLVHTIQTNNMVWAERELHLRFAEKRSHGEWFRLSQPDLDWLVSLTRLDEGGQS